MEKQPPSTSVRHNDDFSKSLIESYANWMSGEGFQQSTLEESIPAEQKQGGTSGEGTVQTPIGSYEKPTFDTKAIPVIDKKVNPDDFSKKDPKANAGAPDSTKIKQSHGAEIRDVTKVPAAIAREEVECCSKCGKPLHEGACAPKSTKEELEKQLDDVLTQLSELTESTYTVTHEKWEKTEKTEEELKEEKAAKKKAVKKIMAYASKK